MKNKMPACLDDRQYDRLDAKTTEILDGADGLALKRAASVLRSGGLVALPTETVYGLGADGLNPDAVSRIYEAKGRPPSNPLILHAADINTAKRLVSIWPDAAQRLADKFWPGPLTIILPASEIVPKIVRANNPTVAIRIPKHPVALELLRLFDGPLAAPSANKTNETSPTKPEHVLKSLGGRIDLILDGGRTRAGIESTIINLAEAPPRLLRPGPIGILELESVIGAIACSENTITTQGPQLAPGMSRRHYAPKARLDILNAGDLANALQELEKISGERAVAVLIGNEAVLPIGSDFRRLPDDARGVSSRLYAILHDLDAEGYQRVLFQAPPRTGEWAAVADRLTRAASAEGI